MISIGIRVTPKKVFFAIAELENEEIRIVNIENVVIPVALDEPRQLTHIRSLLADVIKEYGVKCAGIRLTETSAQKQNIFRLNTEGVIQELLSSSNIESYFCGAIATIASLMGMERPSVKNYIEDKNSRFYEIEEWSTYKKEERESIIVAVAALKKWEIGNK